MRAARYNSCAAHKTCASTCADRVLPFEFPNGFAHDGCARPPRRQARPVYLNLFAIRLPLPAIVSILHRISGALLFLVGIPLLLWVVQRSLASPDAWAQMRATLAAPVREARAARARVGVLPSFHRGHPPPVMDLHMGHGPASPRGNRRAVTLVLALLLTLGVAVKLW